MIPANLFLELIVLDIKVNIVVGNQEETVRVDKDKVGARHHQILIGNVKPIHPWEKERPEVPNIDHLETAAQTQDLHLGPGPLCHEHNQGSNH